MEICAYCGEPRGDKISCCEEVHFEEVTEEELEIMEKHNLDLDEARGYISDMEKRVNDMESRMEAADRKRKEWAEEPYGE